MNDITPPDRRSIRNVPLPSRKQEPVIITRRPEPPKPPVEPTPLYEPAFDGSEPTPKRRGPRIIIWVLSIVCVLVLAGIVTSFFTHADFTVQLKPEPIDVPNLPVRAAMIQSTSTPLVYVPVTTAVSTTTTVTSTTTETVNVKARGRIVVFNKTTTAQPLIATTRFETPAGLIYRIEQDITVPAKRGETDGSIEVTVVADQAGDRYNIGMTDFTIPGFKGTPRYTNFYARSRTAMTGGFTGTRPRIATTTLAQLQNSLTQAMTADVSQVPPSNLYVPIAGLATSSVVVTQQATGTTVTLTASGTTTYYALTRDSLSKFLQSNGTATNRELFDTSGLTATRLSTDGDAVEFTLTGTATLITPLDTPAFVQAVAGKKKAELQGIFGQFPNIAQADVVVRPFWRRSVPSRTRLISVDVHMPGGGQLDSQ
jgi:hypothetical protein